MNDVYVISISADGPKQLYVQKASSSCGCGLYKPRASEKSSRLIMVKRDKVIAHIPKYEKLFVVVRKRFGGKNISKPSTKGISYFAFRDYEVKVKFLTEYDDIPDTTSGTAFIVSWGKVDKLVPHSSKNTNVIYEAYTLTDERAFVGNSNWRDQYGSLDEAYPSVWI